MVIHQVQHHPHAHPLVPSYPHLCLLLVAAALQEAAQCGVALHLLPNLLPLVGRPQPQLVDTLPLRLGRLAVLRQQDSRALGMLAGEAAARQGICSLLCTEEGGSLQASQGCSKGTPTLTCNKS